MYTICYFLNLPREVNTKQVLVKATIKVNKIVFQEFAKFASHLGFESLKNTKLRDNLHLIVATQSKLSKRLLTENGLVELKKWRCALPNRKAYKKNYVFLNLCNIYKKKEIDEGITSFLV